VTSFRILPKMCPKEELAWSWQGPAGKPPTSLTITATVCWIRGARTLTLFFHSFLAMMASLLGVWRLKIYPWSKSYSWESHSSSPDLPPLIELCISVSSSLRRGSRKLAQGVTLLPDIRMWIFSNLADGHRLSWLRFSVICLSPFRKMSGQTSK
jgi:hypothetical protein